MSQHYFSARPQVPHRPGLVRVVLPDLYLELETDAGGGSALFAAARALVRAAQERTRPSDERLPEFADPRLPRARGKGGPGSVEAVAVAGRAQAAR